MYDTRHPSLVIYLILVGLSVILITASGTLLVLGNTAAARHAPVAPHGYVLAWSDDFNGHSVDRAKWYYRTDSKVLSTQLPQNISVGDGILRIAGRRQHAGGKSYTGGGLISRRRFKYGYYEAGLKVPAACGWHTAFWLEKYNPKSGKTEGFKHGRPYQEIDICENDSGRPGSYSANLHKWPAPGYTIGSGEMRTSNLAARFHIVACLYTPKQVTFYFDGKRMRTFSMKKFPHRALNIWLTCIATPWAGPVNIKKLPIAAEFSFVRYYAPPPPTSSIKAWR